MKNLTLTVILVIYSFFSNIASGQQSILDIGIFGGPNLTKLNGNNYVQENPDQKLHYSFGLSTQYNISKIFSITSGLAYEKRGTGFDVSFPNHSEPFKYRKDFNYLVLPLMAKMTFGQKVRGFIGIGGYGAYLLSITEYVPYSGAAIPYWYPRFDYGLAISLGMSFPLKDGLAVTLEARDNFRLGNVDPYLGYTDQVVKATTLNLLIGLTYRLYHRR